MSGIVKWIQSIAAFAFVGIAGYFFYVQAAPLLRAPCEKPIEYVLGEIDPRFGISEATLRSNLKRAAEIWNTAAGKTVVAEVPDGDIVVNLVYSEEQRATELGKTIDAEQAAYDAQKAELVRMKATFDGMKDAYEDKQRSYERRSAQYQRDVQRWNGVGGAPPAEYARLQEEGRELEGERDALNAQADKVNAYSQAINEEVAELNTLAKKINAKVSTYNQNAGEDFDQGHYQSDRDGKRITIYEYTDQEDLTRVLAHEFGHALGMGHIENPDSIMYSFNIGDGLQPSTEDIVELRQTCRLD